MKFNLQSHQCYGFETGITKDGKQVIVGSDWDAFIVIYFDKDGHHLSVDILGKEAALLEQWKQEYLLKEQTICIQEFFIKDRFISLSKMPHDIIEFIEEPQNFDANEIEDYQYQLEYWQTRSDDFVFYWNEEYWCGKDGEVHTS